MCTNSLKSCTSQTQREQMVDRKTSHSRATTLYVPLPVFGAGIALPAAVRACKTGKQLKLSEKSVSPLDHLEQFLNLWATFWNRELRSLSGAATEPPFVTACPSHAVQVEALIRSAFSGRQAHGERGSCT